MTKEELERIKQAYDSGLKVQIWFNGHWENFDARDYSMYSDPFSENRLYRIVGSAYADIAEKRIAELEKENAKLMEKLKNQKAGRPEWHKVADGDLPPLWEGCERSSIRVVDEYDRIISYDYGTERWRDYEGDHLGVQPDFWCEIPKYTEE